MALLQEIGRYMHTSGYWTQRLHEHFQTGAKLLEDVFEPATTAHIAVDLQKGYCTPCLLLHSDLTDDHRDFLARTDATLKEIFELASDCDKAGIDQFWLRHTAEFTPDSLMVRMKKYRPSSHDKEIAEFLKTANDLCIPVDSDKVVNKRYESGFDGTDLEDRLRQENIKTVLITGGLRNYCVQETAKAAANRKFNTFIVDDLLLADNKFLTLQERGIYADKLSKFRVYPVVSDQVRRLVGPAR